MKNSEHITSEARRIAGLPQTEIASAIEALVNEMARDAMQFAVAKVTADFMEMLLPGVTILDPRDLAPEMLAPAANVLPA